MEKILPAQHLLADLFGIEKTLLSDQNIFLTLLKDSAIKLSYPTTTEITLSTLPEGGYAYSLILPIGHISFRSHPEANYLAIDIFLQNQLDPEEIFALWAKNFSANLIRKTSISRGLYGD